MYEEFGFDASTLLYIHDEYLIEVREDQAESCAKEVHKVLCNIFPKCKVPILAEGGILDDWAGLKQGAKKKTIKKQSLTNKLIKLHLLHGNNK